MREICFFKRERERERGIIATQFENETMKSKFVGSALTTDIQ